MKGLRSKNWIVVKNSIFGWFCGNYYWVLWLDRDYCMFLEGFIKMFWKVVVVVIWKLNNVGKLYVLEKEGLGFGYLNDFCDWFRKW